MSLAETLMAEFDHECETTRRFLERLPEDKLTWKPHEKSMSAGQLALHIAQALGGVMNMAVQNSVEMPDFSKPQDQPQSKQEILTALDENIAAVRELLPKITDAQMGETWTGTKNSKVLMTMPRAAFIRMVLLNHSYHHRGQFGVYLRLVGAKVPATYGPSADEMPADIEAALAS